MPRSPCLETGCPSFATARGRCDEHRRELKRERSRRQSQMPGTAPVARRKENQNHSALLPQAGGFEGIRVVGIHPHADHPSVAQCPNLRPGTDLDIGAAPLAPGRRRTEKRDHVLSGINQPLDWCIDELPRREPGPPVASNTLVPVIDRLLAGKRETGHVPLDLGVVDSQTGFRCPPVRTPRANPARSPRSPATSPTPTARRLRGPAWDRGRPESKSSCHS